MLIGVIVSVANAVFPCAKAHGLQDSFKVACIAASLLRCAGLLGAAVSECNTQTLGKPHKEVAVLLHGPDDEVLT